MKRPTELLVLSGGFGTRLRSVVSEVPKPLAPVCDRPYLHYLVESWVEQGVSKLTFLLHHQADQIEAFLNLKKNEGQLEECEIRTLTERVPLGTGGAVAHAVHRFQLTGSFLVANADTWLGTGVREVAQSKSPAIAIVRAEDAGRYGRVKILEDKVAAFEEKVPGSGAGWINAGLYHLHADLFQAWDSQSFSLERDMFPKLAIDGDLKAVPLKTSFIDIGVPEDYFRFCRWIESGKFGVL